MSLCIKRPGGQMQKIAGHTILLDANASEVRQGTWSIPRGTGGYSETVVTFTDPMPDADYIIVVNGTGYSYENGDSQRTSFRVYNKTVTGFTIGVWMNTSTENLQNCMGEYTAFKPIKLEGYTALQNKVLNPDNVPTENSENLVKSGGVWEAIKNASSVFVGTETEWEAADHTLWDIAVLTDRHMILSVNRLSGESAEQANLNKVFHGTQAEWDALTNAQKNYYDRAVIKDNTYVTTPGTLIVAHDMIVATGDWMPDTTYEGYGYKAEIAVADVTADYSPDVRFSFADANSGTFCATADCGTDKVVIYANAVPAAAITIPVIICTLMEV